jgi:serine/threonine-protein kinase RsbT
LPVVGRHVSTITAKSLVSRLVRERAALGPRARIDWLLRTASQQVRLFVGEGKAAAVAEDLRKVLAPSETKPTRIEIAVEGDVLRARTAARVACEDIGARPLVAQKVATAASELARNIVMYAGRGELDVVPIAEPRRGVRLVARDAGPGISKLSSILDGSYKSRTGMGAGIRGVKRLADSFEIETGPTGTTVEFEAWL